MSTATMSPDAAPERGAGSSQPRPHIAVLCRELAGGGSVPFVALRQAQELTRFARVTLLSDSFPERTAPGLARHQVAHAHFRFLRRFSHVPRELAFAWSAKRCLFNLQEHGEQIDFVHCHAHILIPVAAASLRRRFGVPCGLVAHGDVFSSPRGTYDWRLSRLYQWAIPRGYAQADLVVAISPHMRDRAVACGADPLRVELVPNGIGIEEIGLDPSASITATSNVGLAAGPRLLRLLFVGSLTRRKGVDVLLRAAGILKDAQIPLALAVVGEGPARRDLEEYVAANGLAREVTFHGSLRRGDLGRWYRWTDVTCVPSLEDPLPTVVLESLIAGTPVVGSTVGGIPFMVQPGVNGLLIAPQDPGALASALKRVYTEPDFVMRLRLASVASVSSRFSWERNGETLASAITRIIGTSKTS
jgi:glycosyltransferase involved in cell wall biosynthesis